MKEPIRVLCVFSTLDRGGAETMCMNLYRHMDRGRIQFDFVEHTEKKCAFEEEILALGGRIYRVPRLTKINVIQYCQWWKNHFRMHPEHRLVHGHFYTVSGIYLTIARQEHRVAIAHAHIAEIRSPFRKMLIFPIKYIADYRFACGKEAGRLFFGKRSYTVLNNAVDTEKFIYDQSVRMKIRKDLGIEDDTLVTGSVANLIEQKNPRGIINIFRSIKAGNSSAILLWLGDGPLRGQTEELIKKYDLQKSVRLLGNRNNVNEYLQAMDVFILPSYFEGLPVSLIEAQAAGLQCYVSDRVTREADITGLCTFLPIDDSKAWADKILRGKLVHQNTLSAVVRAGYDIKTTSAWLEEFYFKAAAVDM